MFEGATLHNKAWTCPSGPRSCYAPAFATDYSLVKALEQCFTESSDGDCSCSTTACGSAAQHISKWNTSGIALMNDLFKDKMEQMFRYAYSFNYDISSWTGTAATTAQVGMFEVATAFQDKFLCNYTVTGPASSCAIQNYDQYYILAENTCESEGYVTILNLNQCRIAGRALSGDASKWFASDQPANGYGDTGVGRTGGCTFHSGNVDNAIQFFPSASGSCGTDSYHCVCGAFAPIPDAS